MRNLLILKATFVVISFFCCVSTFAFTESYNIFRLPKERSEADYQKYVGRSVIFYKPISSEERNFRLRGIEFGVPYSIESISVKDTRATEDDEDDIVTISLSNIQNPQAKPVEIKCMNGETSFYSSIVHIPAYLVDKLESEKEKYLGRHVSFPGIEYIVSDIIMEPELISAIDEKQMVPKFVYYDNAGNELKESYNDAMSGEYQSFLVKVERPSDESARYGETSMIEEDGISKYSYSDNIIEIVIYGDRAQFVFMLKNVSDHSIKVVWNEAAFVDMNGTTSKIIHKGIGYSQKDEQPASVIIRGAKINDIAIPTELMYYDSYYEMWRAVSMYPSEIGNNGQVTLMLPIQIKETINEYIFVFDVKFTYTHPELH